MSLISPPGSLVGARKPRIEVYPPYAYSLGVEAVELTERAGQTLDPWQVDAVELIHAVRDDGQWACFEYAEIVARQNGKGGIAEARVLAGFFLLDERLIMWSAHEYKTALEAFRRVRGLIRALGRVVNDNRVDFGDFEVKISNTNGEEGFERTDTGARIKFIARSKSSGRGFSGDLNVIDEAFAYTDEQQSALMPTLSARPNAQILYLSSPPLSGTTAGPLFALRARADAGGDASLGFRDWGAAGDLDNLGRIDLDDRSLWARTNPALGIRIGEETIERERRSMTPEDFARERLGVWPKRLEGGGAIDPEVWAALCDAGSRRDGDVALGVDIAPQRDYAAIAVYGPRADDLGHVQLVDYRPGTDWLVGRVVDLVAALEPVAVGMGRATAASLETELAQAEICRPENLDEPERGDLAVVTGADMSAACGELIDAVRQRSLRHIGQRELDASIAGARIRETGDAIAWARKDSSADTSPVVAATVARRAFEQRAHLMAVDYDVLESVR